MTGGVARRRLLERQEAIWRCRGEYCRFSWRVPLVGMARALIRLRLSSAMSVVAYASRHVGKPDRSSGWTFVRRAVLEGESRTYSRMLWELQLRQGQLAFLPRGCREGVEAASGQPGLSGSVMWPGQVHGTSSVSIRLLQQVGPSFTRLLSAHSAPAMGVLPVPIIRGQWPVQVAFTVPARSE